MDTNTEHANACIEALAQLEIERWTLIRRMGRPEVSKAALCRQLEEVENGKFRLRTILSKLGKLPTSEDQA